MKNYLKDLTIIIVTFKSDKIIYKYRDHVKKFYEKNLLLHN